MNIGDRNIHRSLLRKVAFKMQNQRGAGRNVRFSIAQPQGRENENNTYQACKQQPNDETQNKLLHDTIVAPSGMAQKKADG